MHDNQHTKYYYFVNLSSNFKINISMSSINNTYLTQQVSQTLSVPYTAD